MLDLGEALQSLRKAESAHIEWRLLVEHRISGIDVPEDRIPVRETDCEFGKWLDGEGRQLFGQQDHFVLAKNAHETLHAVYHEIHENLVEGLLEQAKRRLPELVMSSAVLLAALTLLERDIEVALSS